MPAILSRVDPAPIGVMPRWLFEEQRAHALVSAISRYMAEGRPVDPLWVEELNDLFARKRRLAELKRREEESDG
jgi:hypothetical protein